MTDEDIFLLINNELQTKTLGTTEQYLEIHQPEFENDDLKIKRIDRDHEGIIIAYLPVKDEYFYFAVYIDTAKKEIFNWGTESRNIVSLRVTSEKLTAYQLLEFTKLTPFKAWNNGDLKPNGKSTYDFSCIEFTPNPEPDQFEDKLEKLLTYLKADIEGVRALAIKADTCIQVIIDSHAGNQLLGTAMLNLITIQTLADLNLGINFDFNAWGEKFK